MNISTVDDPCVESTGDIRAFSVIFTTDDENLDTFRDTATVSILGDPTDRKSSAICMEAFCRLPYTNYVCLLQYLLL